MKIFVLFAMRCESATSHPSSVRNLRILGSSEAPMATEISRETLQTCQPCAFPETTYYSVDATRCESAKAQESAVAFLKYAALNATWCRDVHSELMMCFFSAR
jgi:hypothetical protein